MRLVWILLAAACAAGAFLLATSVAGAFDATASVRAERESGAAREFPSAGQARVAVLAIARPGTNATKLTAALTRCLGDCEWEGFVVGNRLAMGSPKWTEIEDREPPAPKGETPSSPSRMERLARLRNQALDAARERHAQAPFDRALVVDLDVRVDEKELRKALRQTWPQSVRVVAAQGVKGPLYYDTHAHRWVGEPFPLPPQSWATAARKQWKQLWARRSTASRSLIRVQSAFGGLAIYDAESLLGGSCRYDAPMGDCEHVALHRCVGGVHLLPALEAKHWWTRQHEVTPAPEP